MVLIYFLTLNPLLFSINGAKKMYNLYFNSTMSFLKKLKFLLGDYGNTMKKCISL